jgi:hypothetical protein
MEIILVALAALLILILIGAIADEFNYWRRLK